MGNHFEAMPGAPSPEQQKEKEGEAMKQVFETREGERFTVERLTSPEDPRVEEVQKLLARRFGKAEVDPIEVMKQSMTGRMETGEEVPRLIVCVAQNAEGKVVALATGAAVELVDKSGNLSQKQGVLLDAYTVVSKRMQQEGSVDAHLFAMREEAAQRDAESRGFELVGYIVEDGGTDEVLYNRHGANRLYVKNRRETEYREMETSFDEISYIQPPVDWEKETGKPAEGASSVSEHLMIKLTSGADKLSGKDLMAMVRGMFYYNNYPGEDYFGNREAEEAHGRFLAEIERNLAAVVVGKNVQLLSREKREAMEGKGIKFVQHQSEEDHEKESETAAKPTRTKSSYFSAGGPRRRMGESKRAARKFTGDNREAE